MRTEMAGGCIPGLDEVSIVLLGSLIRCPGDHAKLKGGEPQLATVINNNTQQA